MSSPALRITAVQARRAAVHQHQGLGAALVAHARGRRETRAVAGDLDDFLGAFVDAVVAGGVDHRPAHLAGGGYFRVFF